MLEIFIFRFLYLQLLNNPNNTIKTRVSFKQNKAFEEENFLSIEASKMRTNQKFIKSYSH